MLYQPFESAGRSTEAEVTVGGVESILNCSESCQVPPWLSVALQLSESLLVLKVFATGQSEFVTVLSTLMCTVTGLVHQPLLPGVPDEIV